MENNNIRCEEEIEGFENQLGEHVIFAVENSLARMNTLTLTCMGMSPYDIVSEAVERFREFQETEYYHQQIERIRDENVSTWDVLVDMFAQFNLSIERSPEGQEWKKFRDRVISRDRRLPKIEREDAE